jgi:hypothetical protein
MLPGHEIEEPYEQRQRKCCDNPMHYDWIAHCSCGWEGEPKYITAHRIDVLEKTLVALGLVHADGSLAASFNR